PADGDAAGRLVTDAHVIPDRLRPGPVRADPVALDQQRAVVLLGLDAVAVPGDQVAGPRGGTADRVARAGRVPDGDAGQAIRNRLGAVDVRADEVALDRGGVTFVEPDAAVGVARDQVAVAGVRTADQEMVDGTVEEDAVAVGEGRGAAGIGADEVAL